MGLTPASSMNDSADLLLADTELFGQFALKNSAYCPAAANLFNLNCAELVHPMCFAAVVRQPEPALPDSVSNVLATGTEPPVSVVLAWSKVTGVANFLLIRNWSHTKLVAPPVSRDHTGTSVFAPGSVPEEAIPEQLRMPPEAHETTCPGPALIRTSDIDLGPVSGLCCQDDPGHTPYCTKNFYQDDDLARRGVTLDDFDDDVISV